MKKIKQISVGRKQDKVMVFGLGDDGLIYLWQNQIGEWNLYKSEPAKTISPKQQSINDQAKDIAEKMVGYKGQSVRSMLKNS